MFRRVSFRELNRKQKKEALDLISRGKEDRAAQYYYMLDGDKVIGIWRNRK